MALSKKTFQSLGLTLGFQGAEGAIKATASTDNHAAGGNAAPNFFPMLEGKVKDKPVKLGLSLKTQLTHSLLHNVLHGFIDKMVELFEKKGVKVAVVGHDRVQKNNVAEANAKVIIEVRVPAQVDDTGW